MNKQRDDGMWAIDLSDASETKDAIKELFQLEIGTEYKNNYYTSETGDEDFDKIVQAVHTLYPDGDVTVQRMAAVLKLLIASGEIMPTDEVEEPLESPQVDLTPRDRNGKPLSSSQILWSEYRQWSESHSSSECKARANNEESYGSFYKKNLEREFAAEQVGDAVKPEGEVASANFQALTLELRDFARKYAVEPITNLRPKGGLVILDGQQMSWTHFQDLLNRATAAGAIR